VILLLLAGPAGAGEQPVQTYVDGLDFPTNMAFAPDGRLFVTEKNTGRVRIVRDGRLLETPFTEVPATSEAESGLLGLALHPEFPDEPWVYLYYSSRRNDHNVLVRVRAEGDRGAETQPLLRALPVSPYHDGGDMAFGTDGKLYLIVGEAHEPPRAQDQNDLGGKVLRLEPDGSAPGDNPIAPGNPVFSLGHRNSFGLCFDPESGALWETENGPSEHDEVNLILPGANYGWPEVLGAAGDERFVDPAIDFPEIIVPTGCAFYPHPHLGRGSENALFFGDFNGTLHRARLNGQRTGVRRHAPYLEGLGGITDVAVGPDERLYVATTDRILRLPEATPEPSPTTAAPGPSPGQTEPASPPEDGGFPWGWVPWGWVLWALAVAAGAWALRARR
jgi:quinoprotein glucose dehydrogenase